MKTILNVIWFVLSGVWLFLGYMIAGVICCILIVTIPWGIASFRLANYAAWPFGREVINKPKSGCLTMIGNVIWLIVAGWWMALLHVITGVLLCITIVGIPLGVANFKMIGICLVPLGKEIVAKE
jgi:uncharacterized membrane protein YccF (DUF307 family)